MKRVILFILAVSLCLSAFVGCQPTGDEIIDTEPQREKEYVTVAENGLSDYAIISPSKAPSRIRDAAVNALATIQGRIDARLRVSSDKLNAGSGNPHEIVIGECDRPETSRILSELRALDFAIVTAEDGRVYLVGGSNEATVLAVDYFIENFVDYESKTIKVEKNLEYYHRYDYTVGMLSVGGVSIDEYKIVIPKDAGAYTVAAAKNFADYLKYNGGYILEIVSDDEPATDCEILIGKTNRPESACDVSLGKDQYILASAGKKLVVLGDSYMIGGGISELVNTHIGYGDGTNAVDIVLPSAKTAKNFEFKDAKNALLLIGDGMGFNHIEAAIANGIIDTFVAQELPVCGEAVTYSFSVSAGSSKYTDSAAAATALATGYKTTNGYIGIDSKKIERQNVRELAHESGAMTAVLTTDVITGATPGGFLAHHTSRSDTEILQSQIDALIAEKKVDFAVGDIGDELTSEAAHELWTISHGGENFFAMIEEGYIDKHSHNEDLKRMMPTVKRFNELIAYCVEFAILHPDTVLIITADHETGDLTLTDGEYVYNTNEHTNKNVPLFAIGKGTDIFHGQKTNNIEIPKFIASIYGAEEFGQ